MSKDVTKDMTTGKPLLLILQFAFPLLIGNFFSKCIMLLMRRSLDDSLGRKR